SFSSNILSSGTGSNLTMTSRRSSTSWPSDPKYKSSGGGGMATRQTKAGPARPRGGPAKRRQGRHHTVPALNRESPGIVALRKLLREDLDVLSSWRSGALEGDGEAIHQMRVAVRRIRTTLVLFAPYENVIVRDRFNRELRRLGQAFGEARDWEVFLGKTLTEFAREQPARECVGALRQEAEPRMAGAQAKAELE